MYMLLNLFKFVTLYYLWDPQLLVSDNQTIGMVDAQYAHNSYLNQLRIPWM